MNQCDGCQRGLPINKHGNHQGEGYDIIGCTKHLYEGERMSKHTPEPLTGIYVTSDDGRAVLVDADGKHVPMTKEYARRIVACVNACAGLATGALEIISQNKERRMEIMEDVISMDRKISKLERQNAELLEALETVAERFVPCKADYIFSKRIALDKVVAAIAKAKGEV